MMVAGMYRFLVSDFANPIALEGKGAGGGKAYVYELYPSGHLSLANQLD